MNNNNKPNFNLKDFSSVDQSSQADYLIASMEAHYRIESMKAIKNRSLELLSPEKGDRVLDLGCGLGFDTEALAECVGKNGYSIGIDISQRMILEAKARSKYQNAFYCIGDVANVCFPDNYFSGCRADRLLVSQKNVSQVLSEIRRVVRPGGKICITCLDFGTITLYPGSDRIIKIIVEHWQRLVENPFIGRQLPSLLRQHGIGGLKIQPEVFYIRKFSVLEEIIPFEKMLDDIKNQKMITEVEAIELIKELKNADVQDEFYWSINLLTIMGIKQ
ncbi:hypothetical protein BH10PSE19_BH10PSE19_00390 [soil metagenome]